MLFNTLLISGLASLVVAAPRLQSRFQNEVLKQTGEDVIKRGIIYEPRNLNQRKVSEIQITQTETEILSNSQLSSEVELVQIVQEKLIVIDQTKKNKDNIRKNHYKNVNNNVNTIIVIVTAVVDSRDSNNVNTRYLSRQIQSGVQSEEEVMVVIQESQQLNVGSSAVSAGVPPPQASGAAVVNPNVATIDPNAQPSISNATQILPSGVPQPSFGMQVVEDPAIIIEANQQVFVQFVNQQQQQASQIDVSLAEIAE